MFRFGYSRICCGICYLRNKKKEKQAKLAREEEKRQHNIENNQLMMNAQNSIIHNYFKQIAKGFNFQNNLQIENLNDKMKEMAALENN